MTREAENEEEAATERWRRVRAIVEAALEREPPERAAFVEETAGGDDELAREALDLLELESVDALDATIADAIEDDADAESPRLGPWKLLREIGSGGMGTVFLAVRDDGQFKKRVAIKRIKRGMDTDEVLRRFERERQVLATLDHPGIARLLDGGVSDDGRPYLVLEYVEGEPLDRWCDSQRLSIRERIELFCEVCDAVDEAHRSLVVHRDLKPSNVMVDAQGRPRLLDFGIAKMLDPEKGEQTVELTSTPLRLLTPAYASPEQIRGQLITTTSDVYSLGAVLFQILTGRPPFEFETASASEIERVVCHAEPTRCSQVVSGADESVAERRASSPRALARTLDGDLDTVVAKALRKEPRRRYATAALLADDLRRYLRGLPVSARPDTFGYRTAKFVRRHRLGVASAAATLLALVVGLGLSLWQYSEARQASDLLADEVERGKRRNEALEALAEDLRVRTDEAERARAAALAAEADAESQRLLAESRASAVRDFATTLVFDVHRALVPVEGALEARKALVELGIEHLQRLQAEGLSDPVLSRQLIGAYLRNAEIQGSDLADTFGDVEAAISSIRAAVELGESLQAEDPESVPNDYALGSACLALGDALILRGERVEARALFWRAAEVCGIDRDEEPESLGAENIVCECLIRFGAAAREDGDLDSAREHLDYALERSERLADRHPPSRNKVATILFEMAQIERFSGNADDAIALHEDAEGMLQSIIETASGNASLQRALDAQTLAGGRLLIEAERPEEALARAERLVLRFREQADRVENNVQPLRLLVNAYDLSADSAGTLGRWDEALAAARDAESLAEDLVEQQPASGFALHDLARMRLRVGELERARGRLLDAEDAFRASIDDFTRYVDRDPTSAFGLRSLSKAAYALARTHLELADRAGDDSSERSSWLRRARVSLSETTAVMDRLAEVAAFLPPDEELARVIDESREQCEASLGALGEGR
ncbi:MAG: protein kinase [Planctomycetota bacterium]